METAGSSKTLVLIYPAAVNNVTFEKTVIFTCILSVYPVICSWKTWYFSMKEFLWMIQDICSYESGTVEMGLYQNILIANHRVTHMLWKSLLMYEFLDYKILMIITHNCMISAFRICWITSYYQNSWVERINTIATHVADCRMLSERYRSFSPHLILYSHSSDSSLTQRPDSEQNFFTGFSAQKELSCLSSCTDYMQQ